MMIVPDSKEDEFRKKCQSIIRANVKWKEDYVRGIILFDSISDSNYKGRLIWNCNIFGLYYTIEYPKNYPYDVRDYIAWMSTKNSEVMRHVSRYIKINKILNR